MKNYNDTHVRIQLITATKLTNSANETNVNLKEKGIVLCNLDTTNPTKEICENGKKDANILMIDFEKDKKCQQFLHQENEKKDSDCLKYSSIVFLESTDYRSSSPKQNKIKGVPVLTVHTRDARVIRRAFQNNTDLRMDIFYDSLDTMMEHLGGDSDLKKRGCNDLAKEGPIALEETDTEDGKLYLGQGSNVEVKSKLVITCQIYGRDCTALAAWKKQPSNEEAMKNFKVECLDVKMNYKIIGSQIDDFGKDIEKVKERQCYQSDRKNVIQPKRKDDCPPTDCKTTWGNWIKTGGWVVDLTEPDQMHRCFQPADQGTKNIRICREDECLFMELEQLTWNYTDNSCTKRLPVKLPTSPITEEPAYEPCN